MIWSRIIREREASLKEMERLIRQGQEAPEEGLRLKREFRPVLTKDEYCAMVEKGKKYILEGDIFQVGAFQSPGSRDGGKSSLMLIGC